MKQRIALPECASCGGPLGVITRKLNDGEALCWSCVTSDRGRAFGIDWPRDFLKSEPPTAWDRILADDLV